MAGSKIMKRGRGRPSRIAEVKRKVDSFLDENKRTYSKRELAREIGEHPSSVYRALQRCIEGDDLDPPTVVLIVGMGYCHKNHEASQRKRRDQLPVFRQVIREEGATTQREDRVAVGVEKHLRHAETRILGGRILGGLYRRFIQGRVSGMETPESTFRFFTDILTEGETREKVHRTWRIFDRWRRKPEG